MVLLLNPVSNEHPSCPSEEADFCPLVLILFYFIFFGHYPELMAIGEGGNVDRPVILNSFPFTLRWLFLIKIRGVYTSLVMPHKPIPILLSFINKALKALPSQGISHMGLQLP